MPDLSPDFLIGWMFGYLRTAALKAAVDVDLFTAIGQGAGDVVAIASRTGSPARSIAALCDFLAAGGLIEKKAGQYSLPLATTMFLDRRSPAFMGNAHEFLASPLATSLALEDPTRTIREGRPIFADVMADETVWVTFAEAMQGFVRPFADLAVWHISASPAPVRRILDVAAGHGLFGIALAQRYPESLVTAIDSAPVLGIASSNAQAAGLGSRFHPLSGDAFALDWGLHHDVVLLANFLHHYGQDDCLRLLAKAREALAPGGRVVLTEFVPDEDRLGPPFPAIFAFVMTMVTPAGNAYTAAQLSGMLEWTGFAAPQLIPLSPTPQTLVVATRA